MKRENKGGNMKERGMTMRRYVVYLVFAIGAVSGLGVLLAGCEKEGGLEGSGKKVAVNISLESIVYKGNETVLRGNYSRAETVGVHLGGNLYMYARLEEDAAAPTRAGDPLENGVKVRVVAYDGVTVKSNEYTVNGGILTSATALEVDEGTPYTFVAYSYNSVASPTYLEPAVTVAPPNDLLWGSAAETLDAVNNSVPITMSHKFAQVSVKALSDGLPGEPDIVAMSGVTITPGHSADLTIQTGAMDPNAAAVTQSISSWSGFYSTTVTSSPIVFYTGTENTVYVNIGSLTIDGYAPFTGLQAKFDKTLTEGVSYTLALNFKETLFAQSNIYWEWNDEEDTTQGGYLTFDKGSSGRSDYQGVFFQWGSLVGMSPVQTGSDFLVYVPDVVTYPNHAGEWEGKMYCNPSTGNTYAFPDGDHRPPYVATTHLPNNQSENYLYGHPDFGNYKGDICHYIDAEWRMPTSVEFGAVGGYTSTPFGAGPTPTDQTGKGSMEGSGVMYESASGVVFLPPSGYRQELIAYTGSVGTAGNYWTGSVYNDANDDKFGANAWSMSFYQSGNAYPQLQYDRRAGFSVRCVKM